jgi:hypothetical protein
VKRLHCSAILSIFLFGNTANCPADVTLSYIIEDGSGIASYRLSRTETEAIGTAVPGGYEYNFGFGAIDNDNENGPIREPMASLILYGPPDAVTGALLLLSGKTSALPFTVICDVADRVRPGEVEFNFNATFGPILEPLTVSSLRGEGDFIAYNKLHFNGGIVDLNPIYPAFAATPEPSTLLVAVCGASLGLGISLVRRRRPE